MDEPLLLPYDPEVDSFGSKTLRTESGKEITYEDASKMKDFVEKALQVPARDVPIEFTMFVLRKMAVNEKDFRSFEAALPQQARAYLLKLIGSLAVQRTTVHYANDEGTSSFRGALTKIFCKKVICNFAENQEDKHYDRLAAIFPFKVSSSVPKCEMKILEKFDDDFYQEVQFFLNRHFENIDARKMSELFLRNIWDFKSKHFSAKLLLERLENPGDQHDDYLSTFPRLHRGGIDKFTFLYREFTNAMKKNGAYVSEFYNNCDDEYFRRLPEKNFADLYSFFEHEEFFKSNRSVYMRRFRKYLFFFVHAVHRQTSSKDSNPVFFIDDLLFECLKSLRRYKTCEEDVLMKDDLTRITILHYRMNLKRSNSWGKYYLKNVALKRIKKYILESVVGVDPVTKSSQPIPKNPQLNVKYRTDLLTWMPFRTDDACFNVCYSSKYGIKDFLERVLCSVLCPDKEPVRCIIGYNAYTGIEHRYDLPNNVESLRNFIRLCNLCDVTNEPLDDPIDEHIWKTFVPYIETERNEIYE